MLNGVGAGALDAKVSIDPLAGGAAQAGTVVAIDPAADLALVRLTTPLGASIAGLAATNDVVKTEPVDVTVVAHIDDPGHAYRFLDGPGTRGGATLRDDVHPLGWMACSIVVRGMSGAPVRRRSDDLVVGVVSGRYNSADGWLRDCVWIARSERLPALAEDVGPVAVKTHRSLSRSTSCCPSTRRRCAWRAATSTCAPITATSARGSPTPSTRRAVHARIPARGERSPLDERTYEKGVAVSDEQLAAVTIARNEFHGEWNYAISPALTKS